MVSLLDNNPYPDFIVPKLPTAPADTPQSFKNLQAEGPQPPVNVPDQMIQPFGEDIADPGVPQPVVDTTDRSQFKQSPDPHEPSVTQQEIQKPGWMKQFKNFLNVPAMIESAGQSGAQMIPTAELGAIALGRNAEMFLKQPLPIEQEALRTLGPVVDLALSDPDPVKRQMSRDNILAIIPTIMKGRKNFDIMSATNFINKSFDDPAYLPALKKQGEIKYNPFTDPLVQAAFESQQLLDKNYKPSPEFVNSWADKTAGMVGSIAGFAATDVLAGSNALAAFAATSGAGQQFQDAIKLGASGETALQASMLGTIVGLTDVVPIERLVHSPKVTRMLFAIATSAGKQALIEGGQEGLQQFMENVINKYLVKPDQDIWDGVGENALLGALGGVLSDISTGGFREQLKPKEAPVVPPNPTDPLATPPTASPQAVSPPGATTPPAATATPPAAAPIATAPGAAPLNPPSQTAAPAFPEPMKVGEIASLPRADRARESDYVLAHDAGMVDPILKAGSVDEAMKAIPAQQWKPITDFLEKRGVPESEVELEKRGLIKSVLDKLATKGSDVSSVLAPDVINSPQFKGWFGNSKLVDDAGAPLVMYHGTSKDVNFKKFKGNQNGIWFTPDAATASQYAVENDSQGATYNPDTRRYELTHQAARVMPTFVSLKNPKVYDETQPMPDSIRTASNYRRAQADVWGQLKAEGHDGVIFKNGGKITTAVAFNPQQVKSAVSNDGSFDTNDGNISSLLGVPLFDQPLPIAGKVTVKAIGQAMTDRHMATEGRALQPETSDEDYQKVLRHAFDELTIQLGRPASGVGWYSKDVQLSMELASTVFPTLATEPSHRDLFLTFAGIFSNGSTPEQAFMASAEAFEGFLKTGKVIPVRSDVSAALGKEHPTSKETGKPQGWSVRDKPNVQQLQFVANLIDEKGLDGAMKFLQEPQKRTAINERMQANGLYKEGRFTTKAEIAGPDVPGVMAFGEKLGRYTMGLHGADIEAGDVTIDLWFTRTYRRWVGRLMEGPLGPEGVVGGPTEQDRQVIRKLVDDLAKATTMKVGDVQAVLWFFEKRLWGSQGLTVNEGTNSSGARKLLRSKGYDGTGGDVSGVIVGKEGQQEPIAPAYDTTGSGVGGDAVGEGVQGEGSHLPGSPKSSPGQNPAVVKAAKAYVQKLGLPFRRQAFYVAADPARGKRIADEYEKMKHDPTNPEVIAAYRALAAETKAQYQAVLDMGIKLDVIAEGMANPYEAGPKLVHADLKNNHLWFFPTSSGFGTLTDIVDNPLLEPTDFYVGDHRMLVNDLFRVVHDVFGHGLEGAGFGPSGEENAFQAHVRMFTPLAARAMTSETRGQNSWVNFGPHGETNQADQKNTTYADQKTGLMPQWTTDEAIIDDQADVSAVRAPKSVRHAMIHERVRPATGIVHNATIASASIKDMADRFKKALGLTVQVGRFPRGHSASEAIFKWQQSVVRVKSDNDLTTLFHEGGHALHQAMGKRLDDLITTHFAELKHIALNYYGGGGVIDPKDTKLAREEGFAHFFQVWMNNPLQADVIAPGFRPAFETLMDLQEPGLRTALQGIVRDVDYHVTGKSSLDLIREHTVTGEKPGRIARIVNSMKGGNLMLDIGTFIEKGYSMLVGGDYALTKTMSGLAKIAEHNYRVLIERGQMTAAEAKVALDKLAKVGTANPLKMYWATKNSRTMSAEMLATGMRRFRGNGKPVTKGFGEIMAMVTGNLNGRLHDDVVNDFDAYLATRRLRGEWANYRTTQSWLQGGKVGPEPLIKRETPPDGVLLEGDVAQGIKDMEKLYPHFDAAAAEVYKFLDALVDYRVDAGDFTQEQGDYMKAFTDYVPVHRLMEESKLGNYGDMTGSTQGIKIFKGSSRTIVSPLRSITQMVHQQIAVSNLNQTKLSLVDMALDVGQGSGALVEKIPAAAMKGITVNLSDILKASGDTDITASGIQSYGTDIVNLRELSDQIMAGDETATIWQKGKINEKGEAIIYAWRNGKLEAYKLNDTDWADDLYRTLTDLGAPQRGLATAILSLPARALRWGVTSNPIYHLANMTRDAFQTMVAEPGTIPFAVLGKGISNHLYKAEVQQLYNLAGSAIAGRGIEGLDKVRFGIEQTRLQKLGIDVAPMNAVVDSIKFLYSSETLARQGLFARSYDRARKDGLSEWDAMIEAGYSTSDYANYGRGGSKMAELRSIIPFLGASIQSLDKFGRMALAGEAIPAVFRKQFAPWINRTLNLQGNRTSLPLTNAEANSFKKAAKIQLAMMTMALASSLLDSMYWGDEEYEQFTPYMKGTRWMIKISDGKWLAIPKPFQYAFYSTFVSYALDAAYKGDTTAMYKFLESQLAVTSVPYENPGIALAYEMATNKDLFTGRDIVESAYTGRHWRDQSNIYTSELSKTLGQLTGASPMMLDHIITSSFATWGRAAMQLSNTLNSSRPQQGFDDMAFTSYFIKNGSRSTTVKPAFWNLVGQTTGVLTGTYSTYRDLMDGGAQGQAASYLAGASDDEKVFAYLNYNQKPEAKKLHPLRNANDVISALSGMRKEITANYLKLDGGDGEVHTVSPSVQKQLNDKLSQLGIREMRNAMVLTNEPGFGGKKILPTLSIYKEIEAIDPVVAKELKGRLGSKVYSFDTIRKLWPQVRTEILINGEHAKLTPFVAKARAAGSKYFTEGDAP